MAEPTLNELDAAADRVLAILREEYPEGKENHGRACFAALHVMYPTVTNDDLALRVALALIVGER